MVADGLRADIAAARSKMRVKVGGGREIKRLTEYLWEAEVVERMTTGSYGNGNGLIVLTDRRLLFVMDGMISKKSEDFPVDKISSVQWSSGVMLGTITVFASGNKAEIKNVNKDDGKELVDVLRARLSIGPASATSSATNPDVMEQIRQLGDLRSAGLLSETEFETKKTELLKRL